MTRLWIGLGAIGLVAAGTVMVVLRTSAPDPAAEVQPARTAAQPQTAPTTPTRADSRSVPGTVTPGRPPVDLPRAAPATTDAAAQTEAAAALPATSTPLPEPSPALVASPAPTPTPTPTPTVEQNLSASPVAVVPLAAPAAPKADSTQTIVVKKDAVIGIRLDQAILGDTARVDDKITAKVSRDVIVDGVTAIPAGTRLEGVITQIDRSAPGNRGKIGLRFRTLVQADNTRVPLQTDVIFREGDPIIEPTPALNATSGFGAVVTDRTQMGLRNQAAGRGAPAPVRYRDARLPEGSLLTVQLTAPLSLTVHRETP